MTPNILYNTSLRLWASWPPIIPNFKLDVDQVDTHHVQILTFIPDNLHPYMTALGPNRCPDTSKVTRNL